MSNESIAQQQTEPYAKEEDGNDRHRLDGQRVTAPGLFNRDHQRRNADWKPRKAQQTASRAAEMADRDTAPPLMLRL